jgi:23S rRNA (uracil1939-C5)-methyltransferase
MVTSPTEAVLEVERVVAGGDGLARLDSLVVLVGRVLAGERVRARVALRRGVGRGDLVAIERASPRRVEPPCPHYEGDQCGACQLQHASYDEQLRIKAGIVAESFARIARRQIDQPGVNAAGSPWRYRRKLTLALRRRGNRWYAGLRRRDNPDVVFELRDCHITDDHVQDVWRTIMHDGAQFLPDAESLRGSVRADGGGASFILEGGDAWPAAERFFAVVPALRTLWWAPTRGGRRRMAVRGELAAADASFTQVNAPVAAALREHVLARVKSRAGAGNGRHLIDAYSGTGELAAGFVREGWRVTAIELDRDAARVAEARLTPPARVVQDRVERALASVLPADVVTLNPPRAGVDPRVIDSLRQASGLRAIVYVSCDPATLARDVARLASWRVAAVTCFDMFPQTAHVETVCELVPDDGEQGRGMAPRP